MREQLIQYVNLLFAGNDNVEDIKQEILQNTLDRYDDLTVRGKTAEEAYRQAIAGIGDINEILNGKAAPRYDAPDRDSAYTDANQGPAYAEVNQASAYAPMPEFESTAAVVARLMRAVSIFLYIICPIPIFIFEKLGWDEVGVCCTLVIVAIATALLLLFKSPKAKEQQQEYTEYHGNQSSRKALKKSVGSLISTIGLVAYFVISFSTGAWFITWLIFPIIGAVKGVVNSCIDLREDY